MNLGQYLGMSDPPSAPIQLSLPKYRLWVKKELLPPIVEEFLAGLRQGPCSSNALAARLNRSTGYTRATLHKMEAKGLAKYTAGRIKGVTRYIWSAIE